jgi:Mor family transcriptional regulator
MSDIFLRELEDAIASKLENDIAEVVKGVLRSKIKTYIQEHMTQHYRGIRVDLYGSQRPASVRRERDRLIRSEYNGRNALALAKRYGISARMVFRIVGGKK